MAASVEAALRAKLGGDAAIVAVVDSRIFPQLNTQEPEFPELVYSLIGAESTTKLASGSRGLKQWTLRVECYAETEAESVSLGKLVRDCLTPDGSPWRDLAAGVHGCFHQDSGGEFTEDGIRFHVETFAVWFRPTT